MPENEGQEAHMSLSYEGTPAQLKDALGTGVLPPTDEERTALEADIEAGEEPVGVEFPAGKPMMKLRARDIPSEWDFENAYAAARQDPSTMLYVYRLHPKFHQGRELNTSTHLQKRPVSGDLDQLHSKIEEQFGGGEYRLELKDSENMRMRVATHNVEEMDPTIPASLKNPMASEEATAQTDEIRLENAQMKGRLDALKDMGGSQNGDQSQLYGMMMQMFQNSADNAKQDARDREARHQEEMRRQEKRDKDDAKDRAESARQMFELQMKSMEAQNKLLAKQAEGGGTDIERLLGLITGIEKVKSVMNPQEDRGVVGEVIDVVKEGAAMLAGALEAKKNTGKAHLASPVGPVRPYPGGPGQRARISSTPIGDDEVYEKEGRQMATAKVHQVLKILIAETHGYSAEPQWVEVALANLPQTVIKQLADMKDPGELPQILRPYSVPTKIFWYLRKFSASGEDEKNWFLTGFEMIKDYVYGVDEEDLEEPEEPGGLLTEDMDLELPNGEKVETPPEEETPPAVTPEGVPPEKNLTRHPSDEETAALHADMGEEPPPAAGA